MFFFKKGQPAAVRKNTTRSHNPEDKIGLKIVLMSQPEKKKKKNPPIHPSLCLSFHSSINLANNNQAPLVCQTPSRCGGQCPILVLKEYTDSCEWRQVNKCNAMIAVSQAPGSTLSSLLLFSH